MPKTLKKIGGAMKKAGEAVGNVVSPIVLTAFYFVLLPFFAFPYQLGRMLRREDPETSFEPPIRQYETLEDFRNEY